MVHDKEFDKVKKVLDDPEHPDNVETIPVDLTLEDEPTTEPAKEAFQTLIDITDTQEWEREDD